MRMSAILGCLLIWTAVKIYLIIYNNNSVQNMQEDTFDFLPTQVLPE